MDITMLYEYQYGLRWDSNDYNIIIWNPNNEEPLLEVSTWNFKDDEIV